MCQHTEILGNDQGLGKGKVEKQAAIMHEQQLEREIKPQSHPFEKHMSHLNFLDPASKPAMDAGGGGGSRECNDKVPDAVGEDGADALEGGASSSGAGESANVRDANVDAYAASATCETLGNEKDKCPENIDYDDYETEDIVELGA